MEKNTSKKRKMTKRLKRFVIVQSFFLILFLGLVIWFYASGYAGQISEMKKEAERLVRNSSHATFKKMQTSIAYDVNGKTLSVLKGEKDVYYLRSDDIPLNAKNAIISVEDKRFYEHHGIDYKALVRVLYKAIENKKITQGGSTITQQLARNAFLSQERTWQRKLEEIFIASELEKKYSKSSILEFYLNNIYFGNGFYGIQAASIGYFSKEASNLSVSETAFLLAIPNNPTYYDPLTHFNHTLERRNYILENMREERMISENVYDKSIRETIILNLAKDKVQKYDYAETYTFYCATRALMENNGFVFQNEFASDEAREKYVKAYEEMYAKCNASLYSGGYRIYTSIDLEKQLLLQKSIDAQLADFTETTEEGIYTLQSAAVCINNDNGMVNAIVGGRQQDLPGYTLNRGYQSFRQPGSSIKPLIVYTPALERGYTADSILKDRYIDEGPTNADGTFGGNVTLRYAVEVSKNTSAWALFEELTPKVGLSYLKRMNFSRITEEDEVPAASIGGLTNGVSPLEMAKGYATIENDGVYREPTCILRITDAQNNPIYIANQKQSMVYEESAARQMTDILKGVLTEEYATGYGWGLEEIGMPAAAKSGTTNESKDGWFVGYTRYYTTSVWVGYDKPKTMKGLRHSNYPGSIWQRFMLRLHAGLEPKDFPVPTKREEPVLEIPDDEAEDTESAREDEYVLIDGHQYSREELENLNRGETDIVVNEETGTESVTEDGETGTGVGEGATETERTGAGTEEGVMTGTGVGEGATETETMGAGTEEGVTGTGAGEGATETERTGAGTEEGVTGTGAGEGATETETTGAGAGEGATGTGTENGATGTGATGDGGNGVTGTGTEGGRMLNEYE